MESKQIHLLMVVGVIACSACWFGYKAGTYYGANRELSKIIKEAKYATK